MLVVTISGESNAIGRVRPFMPYLLNQLAYIFVTFMAMTIARTRSRPGFKATVIHRSRSNVNEKSACYMSIYIYRGVL